MFITPDKVLFFQPQSKKTCSGYSLEVPEVGTSNDYPQHMIRIILCHMCITPLIWSYDVAFLNFPTLSVFTHCQVELIRICFYVCGFFFFFFSQNNCVFSQNEHVNSVLELNLN